MAIPMSALRRALAEMADMSGSASLRRSIPEALNNTARASIGGASLGAGGGLLANMPDEGSGETLDQYGNRLMRGIGTGAAIGAGLGAGAVGFAGARGLRAALAEAAAERGIGRAAAREASHADDAARFGEASRGPIGGAQSAEYHQSAEYIAKQIRELSRSGTQGTADEMVEHLRLQNPDLAREVREILMSLDPY